MKGDREEREEGTNQDRNDGDWQMGKMDWIDRSTDEKTGRRADAIPPRREIMETDYRKKSTRFLSFQEPRSKTW